MKQFLEHFQSVIAQGGKFALAYGEVRLEFEPKEMVPAIVRELKRQADAWVGIGREIPAEAAPWVSHEPSWIPLLKGVVIDQNIVPGLAAELMLAEDGRSCLVVVKNHAIRIERGNGYVFHGDPKLGYILRDKPQV